MGKDIIKIIKIILVSVMLVGMVGIIKKVSALTYSQDVGVNFTFDSSLQISLSSSDLTIGNLVPGTAADSNIITVNILTNSINGYTLNATVDHYGFEAEEYNSQTLKYWGNDYFYLDDSNLTKAKYVVSKYDGKYYLVLNTTSGKEKYEFKKTEDGRYETNILFKKQGYAVLTISADDPCKSCITVGIHVTDAKISIKDMVLDIGKDYKTDEPQGCIIEYNIEGYGYALTDSEFALYLDPGYTDSQYFRIYKDRNKKYRIYPNPQNEPVKGTYEINIIADMRSEYNETLDKNIKAKEAKLKCVIYNYKDSDFKARQTNIYNLNVENTESYAIIDFSESKCEVGKVRISSKFYEITGTTISNNGFGEVTDGKIYIKLKQGVKEKYMMSAALAEENRTLTMDVLPKDYPETAIYYKVNIVLDCISR